MRAALGVASGLLLAAYPILVYLGLTRWSARGVGLVLLAVLLPPHLIRALRRDRRQHLKAVLPLPLGIAAVLFLAVAVDDQRVVLALPVLINVVLLTTFASTLRGEVSMIERFARMQVDDLSPAEVTYCRRVTWLWCGLFVVNGVVIGALAITGALELWTLWTGGVAYGLVGLLFGVEYLVRKARFRRYGDGLHDRLFARLWPPRRGAGDGEDEPGAAVARRGPPC